jgi:hypothetical protein
MNDRERIIGAVMETIHDPSFDVATRLENTLFDELTSLLRDASNVASQLGSRPMELLADLHPKARDAETGAREKCLGRNAHAMASRIFHRLDQGLLSGLPEGLADAAEAVILGSDDEWIPVLHAFAVDDVWADESDPESFLQGIAAALVFGYSIVAAYTRPTEDEHPQGIAPIGQLARLNPDERLTSLDEPRLALLRQVVEPLQDLAQSLIEGDLDGDDEAELRSLLGAVTFELQNPRHDIVSLERNVGRLAVAASRQQPTDVTVERLVAQLDLSRTDAEQLVDDIKDLTESNTIGSPDVSADRDEAAATLQHTPELLEDLVERTIQQSINDPDGPIAQRLRSIDERLAHRPGSWPTALAQNLAASALFEVFVNLGGPGIALRAVVWTIIAVYRMV